MGGGGAGVGWVGVEDSDERTSPPACPQCWTAGKPTASGVCRPTPDPPRLPRGAAQYTPVMPDPRPRLPSRACHHTPVSPSTQPTCRHAVEYELRPEAQPADVAQRGPHLQAAAAAAAEGGLAGFRLEGALISSQDLGRAVPTCRRREHRRTLAQRVTGGWWGVGGWVDGPGRDGLGWEACAAAAAHAKTPQPHPPHPPPATPALTPHHIAKPHAPTHYPRTQSSPAAALAAGCQQAGAPPPQKLLGLLAQAWGGVGAAWGSSSSATTTSSCGSSPSMLDAGMGPLTPSSSWDCSSRLPACCREGAVGGWVW